MGELVLCAECNRHVREAECPFCGARVVEARSSLLRRASRAALFAIAATPAMVACHRNSVEMYGAPPIDVSVPPDASSPATVVVPSSQTAPVTVYGGPPPTSTIMPIPIPTPKPKP